MAEPLYPERLERLQAYLRRKKISALLVTQPANRRYLSGYTPLDHGIQETAGVLLVPARGKPYLFTDSRYILQARHEALGFVISEYSRGLAAALKKVLPELRADNLGFESSYMLYNTAERLRKMTSALKMDLIPLQGVIERQREIKNEEEIEKIRKSVLLNEKVFQRVYESITTGMTEEEIALAIDNTMRRMGAQRQSFDTIVAFGTNGANPHAVPGSRKLEKDETILVDMGLVLDDYCSDMSRTFVLGKPDPIFTDRLRLVRKAQLAAIKVIRSGVTCREVDQAARQVIREAGYGECFGHALGHGVGLEVHEEPRLSSRSRKKLREGMVVTVEPGIYLPEWGGIRLENMVVVRDTGGELLNTDTTFLDI